MHTLFQAAPSRAITVADLRAILDQCNEDDAVHFAEMNGSHMPICAAMVNDAGDPGVFLYTDEI